MEKRNRLGDFISSTTEAVCEELATPEFWSTLFVNVIKAATVAVVGYHTKTYISNQDIGGSKSNNSAVG